MAWIIVCPDGARRHHPYANERDAQSDARSYERNGCATRVRGVRTLTSCPGGEHPVEHFVSITPPPAGQA